MQHLLSRAVWDHDGFGRTCAATCPVVTARDALPAEVVTHPVDLALWHGGRDTWAPLIVGRRVGGYRLDMVLRVVLAEDNVLLRQGVMRLIEDLNDVELTGACGDFNELVNLVDAQQPDVVITDIRMPPSNSDEGIRAAAHFRSTSPSTGVVVLSQFVSPAYALELVRDGSAGRAYLLKERVADAEELLRAVRTVARGGSVMDPQVVDALLTATRRSVTGLNSLTPRERDVLSEMATGKSNSAIGSSLVLSERAVEKHINSIFSKLGLSSEPDVNRRVKAVLFHLSGGG